MLQICVAVALGADDVDVELALVLLAAEELAFELELLVELALVLLAAAELDVDDEPGTHCYGWEEGRSASAGG